MPAPKPAVPAAEEAAPIAADDPVRPRRFADTLSGDTPALVAPTPASPADLNEPAPREASETSESVEPRRRHVSTIVGHPATPPQPPSAAPVLSPPKWRGAQAYLEGEEPQPRISSIPTPPSVGTTWSAPPSKVTTKIGPPSALEPPAPVATDPDAISDTIQEMLDGQASVPMQVEEPGSAEKPRREIEQELPIQALAIGEVEKDEPVDEVDDDEPPMEELAIDEELDALVEPEPLPAGAMSGAPGPAAGPPVAPRPLARIALRPDPTRSAESQVSRLPSAVVEVAAAPTERVSPNPQPAAIANSAAPAQAKRSEAASAGPQRSAAGKNPTSDERKHTRSQPSTSSSTLAPTETARSEDSRSIVGAVLVAAMVLIGVGGWFWTRGGYPGPAHLATRPPDPAAAQAPIPPPPAQTPSVAPASVKAPGKQSAPASVAAANDGRAAKPAVNSAKHVHNGVKPQSASDSKEDEERAAPSDSSESPVLRVVPHDASRDAPDIPSRDNVLAALAPIRPAVAECARGQHGTAQLDITVASTGFVTQAIVGGDFAGTPAGSCIARAARTAQFVAFKKPRFRVIYPFSL